LRINATSLFQREVLHRQSFALTVRLAGKTMVQLIVMSTSSVSFGNDCSHITLLHGLRVSYL
jgi:hypothetical protein